MLLLKVVLCEGPLAGSYLFEYDAFDPNTGSRAIFYHSENKTPREFIDWCEQNLSSGGVPNMVLREENGKLVIKPE